MAATEAMQPIDMVAAFAAYEAERLSKPPFKMFKAFPADFERCPTTSSEIVHMQEHNRRLYPNALRWHEHRAEEVGWRATSWRYWPDDVEEWDSDVDELVERGSFETRNDARNHLYANVFAFKEHMDACWESMRAEDRRDNLNHLWSVAHRHVTKWVWMRRLAGRHWKARSSSKRALEDTQ